MAQRQVSAGSGGDLGGPLTVCSVRIRPDQARWMAEMAFRGNRELEDAAAAAGTFRPPYRLGDSDVIRVALDRLMEAGSWDELREAVLAEGGRVRPGRPPSRTT